MGEYTVSFTIADYYDATLDETFRTEREAEGVAARLEETGNVVAYVEEA